jgi:hypothetical protein
MENYDMSQNTAATGGMEQMPTPMQSPDETPGLSDPTQFPEEPITSGLPIGAGDGPMRDTRRQDTKQLRKYLPLLETYIDRPDVPDSVRALFRYIRSA